MFNKDNSLRRKAILKTTRATLTFLAAGVSSVALFTHPALSQTAAQAGPAQAENVLNRQHVDQLLATPDKVTFIDLRRADEIAAIGSLPVYLNIQVSELD